MASRKTILVFDSGLGGLTVYREVAAARPDADFVYVADDAAFPYGAFADSALVSRVVGLLGELIETHRPDLVVVACNTASTLVLPDLRKKFSVPFVGTVPAIKPACAGSVTRRVSVLGTEGTVTREYTRALIRDYALDCRVTLVGSKSLAAYAEAELRREPQTGQSRVKPHEWKRFDPQPQAFLYGTLGAVTKRVLRKQEAEVEVVGQSAEDEQPPARARHPAAGRVVEGIADVVRIVGIAGPTPDAAAELETNDRSVPVRRRRRRGLARRDLVAGRRRQRRRGSAGWRSEKQSEHGPPEGLSRSIARPQPLW